MVRRRCAGLLTAVAVIGLTVGLSAVAASAHVTVQPSTATEGSFTKISFRVPNEDASADTTQFEVQLPTDHPIASVSVQPKDGWTYTVTKATLPEPVQTDDGELTEAVSGITWTGGSIKPGEFDEFSISAGPLPTGVETLTFKALQTYSDGNVVRWIDETTPGAAEPEHPAPTLTLTKAAAGDSAAAPEVTSSSSDDSTARALGIIGIVVGVIGLAVGAGALIASRRKPAAG